MRRVYSRTGGQNFIDLAKQEMPEKLALCTTGSRFTFST
jgi:hypothetical protein